MSFPIHGMGNTDLQIAGMVIATIFTMIRMIFVLIRDIVKMFTNRTDVP